MSCTQMHATPATDNAIQFPGAAPAQIVLTPDQLQAIITAAVQTAVKPAKSRSRYERTASPYKKNGVKKATAADPIRSREDFATLANYLLNNGSKRYRVRNYTMLVVGTTLGLRCGDLMRLTLGDVFDFERLNEAGKPMPRSHISLINEKTGKRTTDKLTEAALEALTMFAAAYPLSNPNYPLFCSKKSNPDGTPRAIDDKQAWEILNGAAKAAGLSCHVSTHSMRKTYGYGANEAAKTAGRSGEALELLQLKYAHSDQRTTMRYTGIGQDEVDDMADSVSDWLLSKV